MQLGEAHPRVGNGDALAAQLVGLPRCAHRRRVFTPLLGRALRRRRLLHPRRLFDRPLALIIAPLQLEAPHAPLRCTPLLPLVGGVDGRRRAHGRLPAPPRRLTHAICRAAQSDGRAG